MKSQRRSPSRVWNYLKCMHSFMSFFRFVTKWYIPIAQKVINIQREPYALWQPWYTFKFLSILDPAICIFVDPSICIFVVLLRSLIVRKHILCKITFDTTLTFPPPLRTLYDCSDEEMNECTPESSLGLKVLYWIIAVRRESEWVERVICQASGFLNENTCRHLNVRCQHKPLHKLQS